MSHHIFVVAAFGRLRNAVFVVVFFQTPIWKTNEKITKVILSVFIASADIGIRVLVHASKYHLTNANCFQICPCDLISSAIWIRNWFLFSICIEIVPVNSSTHTRTHPAAVDVNKQYRFWCALAIAFNRLSSSRMSRRYNVTFHMAFGRGFSVSFKLNLHTHDYIKIVFGYQTSSNLNLRRPTLFDVPDYTITQIRNSPNRNNRSCFTISTNFCTLFSQHRIRMWFLSDSLVCVHCTLLKHFGFDNASMWLLYLHNGKSVRQTFV